MISIPIWTFVLLLLFAVPTAVFMVIILVVIVITAIGDARETHQENIGCPEKIEGDNCGKID